MRFETGMKVVSLIDFIAKNGPKKDNIYTIERIHTELPYECLSLEGIKCYEGFERLVWASMRFVPLDEWNKADEMIEEVSKILEGELV